jgi:leucyl aminopeptidase
MTTAPITALSPRASASLLDRAPAGTLPLHPVVAADLPAWREAQPKMFRRWLVASGFEADAGAVCLLPGDDGSLAGVLVGVEAYDDPWAYAGLPNRLPAGSYRLAKTPGQETGRWAALGWALGSYTFDRYRKAARAPAKLVWPKGCDRAAVTRTIEAVALVRDLVNTPADDLGPAELAATAKALAERHDAKLKVIVGDALLKRHYPAIHAVGRASRRAPRLIDLKWGNRGRRVTLVGKGVCFDSGGLDLKSAQGMLLMKKDMGGAAHVLALAHMVMAARLPLRLRVLVPAVENLVSADAFKPLDVLATRKGLTVEVGNTDAEGRLILCDALAEAVRGKSDLIVDFATLTGAARVALGAELPALFCNDEVTAAELLQFAAKEKDPLWRLPLHAPYRRHLKSQVADLSNIGKGAYGGAITAALFLEHFVEAATPWVHLDVMAWNNEAQPGRPIGGEAMGLRAVYALIAAEARKKS